MIVDLNIGGILFHLEPEASEQLLAYRDLVHSYFDTIECSSLDISGEIDNTISSYLLAKMNAKKQIITLADIENLKISMGDIKMLDGIVFCTNPTQNIDSSSEPKKLYRDEHRKLIAGVASGMAHYLGIDPLFIRLSFLISLLGGYFDFSSIVVSLIALYSSLWIFIPASYRLKEDNNTRHFFRDGENKMLGGVSGGIAAYFGIQSNVIRALFAAGVFLGGFTIILYSLLWFITPEAASLTQRMQMGGEAITLKNIEQKVLSTLNTKHKKGKLIFDKVAALFHSSTKNIAATACGNKLKTIFRIDDSTEKKLRVATANFSKRLQNGGNLVLNAHIKNLASATFSAAKRTLEILTGFMLLFNTALISTVSLVILEIFIGVGIFNFNLDALINVYDIRLPLNIARSTFSPATVIFMVALIEIPFVYFGLRGFQLITKKRIISPRLNSIFGSLLLVAVIGTASTLPFFVQSMDSKGTFLEVTTLKPNEEPLTIGLTSQNIFPTLTDAKLIIKGHNDDYIELTTKLKARGKTHKNAISNAKGILYKAVLSDSVLLFDANFKIDSGVPFRHQELFMELRLPFDKEFIMTKELKRILVHTLSPQGFDVKQLGEKNKWTYKKDGLHCLTCDTESLQKMVEIHRTPLETEIIRHIEDSTENAMLNAGNQFYTKENILIKEKILEGFKKIKVKGAFDVLIVKSDSFKIISEGDEATILKTKIRVSDSVLLIINKESLVWKEGNIHTSFIIETPSLDKIAFIGPIQARVIGFEQEKMKIYLKGSVDCEASITVQNLSIMLNESSSLNLEGEGKNLNLSLEGDTKANTYNFFAENVNVKTKNSAYAKVYVSKELKMYRSSYSKIKHRGNGKIITDNITE